MPRKPKKASAPKKAPPRKPAEKPAVAKVIAPVKDIAVFDGVKFDISGVPKDDREFDRASVVRDEKGKPISVTLVSTNWRKYRVSIDGAVEEVPRMHYPVMVKEDPVKRKARADALNEKARKA